MEGFHIPKQHTAWLDAINLQHDNPSQIIYVIYNYEEQCFEAVTQEWVDTLQSLDWDFTIIGQLDKASHE